MKAVGAAAGCALGTGSAITHYVALNSQLLGLLRFVYSYRTVKVRGSWCSAHRIHGMYSDALNVEPNSTSESSAWKPLAACS